MMLQRAASLASAVLVAASLSLAPIDSHAGPEPSEDERPVEGPARPPAEQPPAEQPPAEVSPPPPTFVPTESTEPGVEFVVPPPESETETEDPQPTEQAGPLAETWPDPGIAPSDGNGMLALGGGTLIAAAAAFGTGLTVGLADQIPLEYLLPATIIPTTLTAAFGVGALAIGIKRARTYRSWEIGYRVVGEPQGAGLRNAGLLSLLTALVLLPVGARMINLGDPRGGAIVVGLGSAAAVATPIMLIVGKRRANRYALTGGWHRRPLPPIPGQAQSQLHVTPLVVPTLSGFMVGASGRF